MSAQVSQAFVDGLLYQRITAQGQLDGANYQAQMSAQQIADIDAVLADVEVFDPDPEPDPEPGDDPEE